MNEQKHPLVQWIGKSDGMSQRLLADTLGVSQGLISQWGSFFRPIALRHCARIEQLTNGEVTRRELRPDDWHLIWPELVTNDAALAPQAPASSEASPHAR